MGIQKPTKAEEKYIQEQKDRAQRLFWILLGVFAVSLFFLLLFQFKWWFLAGLTDAELKTFDSLKWALAALIGSGVYLIGQIGTYYQKIDNTPEEENQDDFIKQTYWYYSTLLKAPIMAVVIIWLLANLTIDVGDSGVAIDFSKFAGASRTDPQSYVMIGVAFILGFFGRVAQKQLEIIAKYIFSRAWALAEQGFYVQGNDVILLGEEAAYKTSPASEVLWAATPVGTIKADSGVYTAPSTPEEHGKPVFIQAMLKGETSITAVKEATLKLFKISGPTDVESGGEINLSLETRLIDKITEEELKATKWTADDTAITIQPDVERAIKFNAPAVTKEDKEKTIRITATLTHDNKSYSDDLIITVLPKKEEGA